MNDNSYSLVMSAIDHRKHQRNFKRREGLLAAMLSGAPASAGLVKTRSHACISLNCNTVVIAPPLGTNKCNKHLQLADIAISASPKMTCKGEVICLRQTLIITQASFIFLCMCTLSVLKK